MRRSITWYSKKDRREKSLLSFLTFNSIIALPALHPQHHLFLLLFALYPEQT